MEDRSPSTEIARTAILGDKSIEPARSASSVIPKACENCRIRKIRCDKTSPCSSCQMVNLPCKVATKTPDRARATSTTYHEKHFSLIHESLLDIKEKLRKLDQNQASIKPPYEVCILPVEHDPPSVPEATFQGESSFDSHSARASLSAEFSAREAEEGGFGQQIHTSLSSLKSLLRTQGRPSSADDLWFPHSSTKVTNAKVDLPPVSAVLTVLKRAAVHTPFVILHSAQRDHSILEDLCKKVYFPTRPFSKGELTLMNGMLSFLFAEYSANVDEGLSSSDCATYAKLCEKNFTTGLQDYECLVTPTLENIQCLMIGAMKAQEDSLPSLCWTFVSAGARLCQILGYHREVVVARDPPKLAEVKRHAFWMLYMMDKTLSLNLGRTSCFPDYDIDVEVFSPSLDPRFWPWDQAFLAFIEFSKLQGRLYDELYTARAQREQPETRLQAVEELSSMFFAWHVKFKEINTNGAQDKSDLDLIIGSSDFIYYSALNLLYGAKTSPAAATHISSQRYEAARLSLQCHIQNCAKLTSSDTPRWRIYSDWILLYSSFTPFLVVFTHSIASHSKEDIELLGDVLNTLEAPRRNTEALDRLYQVCRVFLEFAKAFVPSRQPSFGFYNEADDSFTFPTTGGDTVSYNYSPIPGHPIKGGSEAKSDDLESMSQFLGTCLGENSAMSGLWNIDFSNSHWI